MATPTAITRRRARLECRRRSDDDIWIKPRPARSRQRGGRERLGDRRLLRNSATGWRNGRRAQRTRRSKRLHPCLMAAARPVTRRVRGRCACRGHSLASPRRTDRFGAAHRRRCEEGHSVTQSLRRLRIGTRARCVAGRERRGVAGIDASLPPQSWRHHAAQRPRAGRDRRGGRR